MRFGLASSDVPAGRPWRPLALALAFVLLVLPTPGPAHAQGIGDLAVVPTRVILEGRERTAKVSVLNRGSETATYRISIINMQMTESGEYRRVTESGVDGGYAESLVRYAPRQVELAPGKSDDEEIRRTPARNVKLRASERVIGAQRLAPLLGLPTAIGLGECDAAYDVAGGQAR